MVGNAPLVNKKIIIGDKSDDIPQIFKKCGLKTAIKYFENKELKLDQESLSKIEDTSLIVMISMVCPFSINEKQMLLESKNVNILTKTVIALLEASINENLNYEAIN